MSDTDESSSMILEDIYELDDNNDDVVVAAVSALADVAAVFSPIAVCADADTVAAVVSAAFNTNF
eukprot:4171376-Ditylum_brightwellii.AAC.1